MIPSYLKHKFITLSLMKSSHFCYNTCFENVNLFHHDWYIFGNNISQNFISPYMQLCLSETLDQFPIAVVLPFQRTIWQCLETSASWPRDLLPASSGQRPRTMTNIPQWAREPPQHKIMQYKMSAMKRVQNMALGGHRELSCTTGMYNTLTQTLQPSTSHLGWPQPSQPAISTSWSSGNLPSTILQ